MYKFFYLFLLVFIIGCTVRVDESMVVSPSVDINSNNLIKLKDKYEALYINNDIYALHKASPSSKVTILVLHGNALNLTHQPWFGLMNTLAKLDVNVLAIDYRGFGLSKGSASMTHMVEDSLAALEYISEDQSVLVYGLSLGSLPALSLKDHRKVKGFIIEGGVSSTADMVALYQNRKVLGSFVKVELEDNIAFDNVELVAQIQSPILVIHGKNDQNIPIEQGEQIFNAVQNTQSIMYSVEGGGHCDTFYVDEKTYLHHLNNYLTLVFPDLV